MAVSEKKQELTKYVEFLSEKLYNYYLSRKYKKQVHSRLKDSAFYNAFINIVKKSISSGYVSVEIYAKNLIDYGLYKKLRIEEYCNQSGSDNFIMYLKTNDYIKQRINEDTLNRINTLYERGNLQILHPDTIYHLYSTNQLFMDVMDKNHKLFNVLNAIYTEYKKIMKIQNELWRNK